MNNIDWHDVRWGAAIVLFAIQSVAIIALSWATFVGGRELEERLKQALTVLTALVCKDDSGHPELNQDALRIVADYAQVGLEYESKKSGPCLYYVVCQMDNNMTGVYCKLPGQIRSKSDIDIIINACAQQNGWEPQKIVMTFWKLLDSDEGLTYAKEKVADAE